MSLINNPFGFSQQQQGPFNQGIDISPNNNYPNQFNNNNSGVNQFAAASNSINGLINSPLADIGLQYTKQAVQSSGIFSGDFITSRLFSNYLRYYFDVSNNYVLNKLLIIICPFVKPSPWVQTMNEFNPDGHLGFLPAKDEIHAPDLYLPLMGLLTFILISCLSIGIGDDFRPDIISENLIKCFFISGFEVILVYIGFFLVKIQSYDCIDLLSHLSYRYVPLVIILVTRLLLGKTITTFVMIYCLMASGVFLFRTLKRYENSVDPSNFGGHFNFAQQMFMLISVASFIFSYFLLYLTGAY